MCDARTRMSRKPAPMAKRGACRRQRSERETDVWMRQVTCLGALSRRGHSRPCRRSWCRHVSVLQRPVKPRRPIFWCERLRIEGPSPEEERHTHLLDEVRAWKAPASRPFHVPGSHGRTARSTVVQLAYGALTVLPPRVRETVRQRAAEGVGHPCLGRADP